MKMPFLEWYRPKPFGQFEGDRKTEQMDDGTD